ncbi:cyclopropane-fatty-acyl-phospholipid synthase [Rhodoplanes sp. TEM]|uniref:Cyclopropane-fatty-acyl-phospholipid synthase n=1 Tax=Rhodoplanes tepidamans TaxID=200616 RepID=A0ABT5JGK2_RHOTP|nr:MULTISPECIES: cyclopropane-fatty-acyl-phospholipid synthase family protein [Rhodoplanes]MDC7788481.1 cyclopropane-fatty-acyl-phospholipid synthase [Rhodoplanes tepidamans]MDC7987979.1 cyclopropane-fatty-acyl-phospholipid synthase [Rhodoplanes sp. TEM]MDQ0358595.1 cyclopropane-fatty-acyl-phospholipid synthase [Rhodoplanes tepidamans]
MDRLLPESQLSSRLSFSRLPDRLLRIAFAALIRHGSLRVTTAAGSVFVFGDGAGPPVAVRFTRPAAQWAVLLDPELRLGEAFMDGTFVVEQGTIADFLRLVTAAVAVRYPIPWIRPLVMIRWLARRLAQWNRRHAARRNVAHHYDLDGRLYALFLDSDRQYSCAYFERPDASLDDAQLAKKRHIAAKLLLTPGQRVLDIGCGWGGLALYLAEVCGADVTGLTLSTEQLAVARARARDAELGGRVRFRLQDYRDVPETFDRIVSVGMFEHVGVRFYDAYFQAVARALSEDGVVLLHAIGRSEGPAYTNPWIAKYIFPGGYIPALSEVLPAIERAGLLVTDIEILRLHYADTLAAWRERFLAHRDDALKLYDCRFVRMWEFYLAASEMAFREQNMMVFQIQLAKRQGVVPVRRDYMAREENRLRAAERGTRAPLRLAGE